MATVKPSGAFERSGPQTLGETTEADRLANADALLANLGRFGWPEMPERPENLQSDQELWTAYRKLDRGDKLSKEDKEQLRLLSNWRSAVLHIETKTAGRLLTIVSCLRTLEQACRIEPGEPPRPTRTDDAERLRAHLSEQFHARYPSPAPPYSRWVCLWAEHFARNYVLLPMHLRKMTRPPADQGWTRPDTAQRGLGFAEED